MMSRIWDASVIAKWNLKQLSKDFCPSWTALCLILSFQGCLYSKQSLKKTWIISEEKDSVSLWSQEQARLLPTMKDWSSLSSGFLSPTVTRHMGSGPLSPTATRHMGSEPLSPMATRRMGSGSLSPTATRRMGSGLLSPTAAHRMGKFRLVFSLPWGNEGSRTSTKMLIFRVLLPLWVTHNPMSLTQESYVKIYQHSWISGG